MVYTTFQNQAMKIDYLTGLYNRRQLVLLKSKINNLSKNYKLAGIMIDIIILSKLMIDMVITWEIVPLKSQVKFLNAFLIMMNL